MIITKLKDFMYPKRCPICDDVLPAGEKICPACRVGLKYIKEPRCMKCGKGPLSHGEIFCHDCRKTEHVYDRGFALYDYSCISESVYRFKYEKRQEYADFYADEIYEHLYDEVQSMKTDCFIPVPISAQRLYKRGYNQAGLIAAGLSDRFGIPCFSDIVVRARNTAPLKTMGPSERQNNLKGSFKMTCDDVKCSTTIIIDDIYTTGSTIDEISRLLKKSGVRNCFFITLSIGKGI